MLQLISQRLRKRVLHFIRLLQKFRNKLTGALAKEPTRLAARDETRRSHAEVVVDLFATIMAQVEGLGMEDMDTTMDMLRYDFPNVEHSWLAERFQNSYTAGYMLSSSLALAAADRTLAERMALALEILTMLYRVGGDLTNPTLFEQVTDGLKLPEQSRQLEKLRTTPGLLAPAPLEVLRFSEDIAYANVTLSSKDKGVRFRAVNCAQVLLIINDADTPLHVQGRVLNKQGLQILSPGQHIELNGGNLTYSTIRSLLQAHYTNARFVAYLHCENEEVFVSRSRHKNSIAKLKFGVHVEIEVLRKDARLYLDEVLLPEGCTICASYYTPFTVSGLGPYYLAELHQLESPGKSFQLAPECRKLLVTNLPYVNKSGALMLTPGLAPGCVFEVSYSSVTGTGSFKLIEGVRHAISINDIALKDDIAELQDGDLIQLGQLQSLRCRFIAGVLDEETSLIQELKVTGLTRDFVRAGRVVDNIDFSLCRGEMACILGPSGSGKSTLLNMLAGHLSPSFGSIHYNNQRLTTKSSALRRHIAFIPREDILESTLTVGEHVYQASVSRRPRLMHADRMRRVQTVLGFVGLSHLISRRVGKKGERSLSDGERTRLNLALDLTSTSEVFLIDEPISGLASVDAEQVIDTLKQMSTGRILICTLHRPSQTILNQFAKVMVLNNNGQMAFWGTPAEMQEYFQRASSELGLHISREAQAAGGAEYAFEVMAAPFKRLGNNKLPHANMWQERFEKHQYSQNRPPTKESPPTRPIPPLPRRSLIELWRLFKLWVTRTFVGRVRSRMSLYALLLEAPVLALLIAGTLRAASTEEYVFYHSLHITEYLFLSLVLAMFFGLTDSACEIIRDRNLIRRESNYKLFIPGYLMAKILVLSGIASLQCALYLMVSNLILDIRDMFWPHFGIMSLTAFIGIAMSLMVSSLVKAEKTALNIVPLLLVPQILLAGALIRFEDMNEFCPKCPDFVPDCITETIGKLRHRVAYQDRETHEISSKPVPLIAELCPLRYSFEMMFVAQAHYNLWDIEYEQIEQHRQALRHELDATKHKLQQNHLSDSERCALIKDHERLSTMLRFVNDAVLLINSAADSPDEAKDILRLARKAALTHNQELMDSLVQQLESKEHEDGGHAVDAYFTNQKIIELREGVNLARKDNRINENRGFFLAPRQPIPFSSMDQHTEDGSISTLWRDSIYLLIMGLCPIIVAAWRLRRICRSG